MLARGDRMTKTELQIHGAHGENIENIFICVFTSIPTGRNGYFCCYPNIKFGTDGSTLAHPTTMEPNANAKL